MTTAPALTGSHPRGLYTLFFTEMWERFSYYGMRALLVLFMVDSVRGGMGMTDQVATAVYGLYTAGVYLAALPGGWVADRLVGARRAVWIGGLIITAGHFTLAIPSSQSFYLGLILIVLGTGLLKPNVSALVGELYPQGGAKRDAGFTIFYMGINIGAALGPLVCSTLGEKVNWHAGFAAAGFGMILGLVQFRFSMDRLGTVGLPRADRAPLGATATRILWSLAAAAVVFLLLCFTGSVELDPVGLARGTTAFIATVAGVYFAGILLFGKLDQTEKRRVGVIIILFVSSAIFWAGFEQVGSSFNLFAERYTERHIASLNWEMPTGWFQSLGPIFIIAFAPVFAWLWVKLSTRNLEPSLGIKFGVALVFLAGGFAVMAAAASVIQNGEKAWPTWLIATFLLHTFGELCLSPVGLSSVTKLAPARYVGQMMGSWFLASSLGSVIAGLLAGEFSSDRVDQMPRQFLEMAWLPLAAAVVLLALTPLMKRWSRGVQ